jgi:ribosome-associated protein
MPEPLVVAPGVVVPAHAITVTAVRSSGPGGQNVNKVSSRVEVRVALDRVPGLSDAARARLRAAAGRRVLADGVLLVSSQRTRDQHRNLEDARARIAELVAAALPEPVRRRPTRPSRASGERRIQEKKRRAATKRIRGARGED